jgi:hypothetical protein
MPGWCSTPRRHRGAPRRRVPRCSPTRVSPCQRAVWPAGADQAATPEVLEHDSRKPQAPRAIVDTPVRCRWKRCRSSVARERVYGSSVSVIRLAVAPSFVSAGSPYRRRVIPSLCAHEPRVEDPHETSRKAQLAGATKVGGQAFPKVGGQAFKRSGGQAFRQAFLAGLLPIRTERDSHGGPPAGPHAALKHPRQGRRGCEWSVHTLFEAAGRGRRSIAKRPPAALKIAVALRTSLCEAARKAAVELSAPTVEGRAAGRGVATSGHPCAYPRARHPARRMRAVRQSCRRPAAHALERTPPHAGRGAQRRRVLQLAQGLRTHQNPAASCRLTHGLGLFVCGPAGLRRVRTRRRLAASCKALADRLRRRRPRRLAPNTDRARSPCWTPAGPHAALKHPRQGRRGCEWSAHILFEAAGRGRRRATKRSPAALKIVHAVRTSVWQAAGCRRRIERPDRRGSSRRTRRRRAVAPASGGARCAA